MWGKQAADIAQRDTIWLKKSNPLYTDECFYIFCSSIKKDEQKDFSCKWKPVKDRLLAFPVYTFGYLTFHKIEVLLFNKKKKEKKKKERKTHFFSSVCFTHCPYIL